MNFRPYTESEIEEIIKSPNYKETAVKLGRTIFAVSAVRNEYSHYIKTGELKCSKEGILGQTIVRLAKDGVRTIKMRTGWGRKQLEQKYDEVLAEGGETKDPFTEFSIIMAKFNSDIRRLVYQMADEALKRSLKSELERLVGKLEGPDASKILMRKLR